MPTNSFFTAWSQTVSTDPIQTQTFSCDPRQQRQFIDWYVKPADLAFAKANPGQLYIIGDEPDQFCQTPELYAGIYEAAVEAILAVDSTARFSPAGFAEPNAVCAIAGVENQSWHDNHSMGYAQKFLDAYYRMYHVNPPIAEWRFHDFGLTTPVGDLQTWLSKITTMVNWSMSHGAPMYLGSWGFHSWKKPDNIFVFQLLIAMQFLGAHPNIVGAAWWSYEPWTEAVHPLFVDQQLTPVGRVYAGLDSEAPMPDIQEQLTKLSLTVGDSTIGPLDGTNNIDLPNGEACVVKSLHQLHNFADNLVGVTGDDGSGGRIGRLEARIAKLEAGIK